jgi:hypothetical protein
MAKTRTKKNSVPTLVRVGNHFVDPTDVACISKIKGRNLYVIRLKSQPNMEYPIWANEREVNPLLTHFNLEISDEEMD